MPKAPKLSAQDKAIVEEQIARAEQQQAKALLAQAVKDVAATEPDVAEIVAEAVAAAPKPVAMFNHVEAKESANAKADEFLQGFFGDSVYAEVEAALKRNAAPVDINFSDYEGFKRVEQELAEFRTGILRKYEHELGLWDGSSTCSANVESIFAERNPSESENMLKQLLAWTLTQQTKAQRQWAMGTAPTYISQRRNDLDSIAEQKYMHLLQLLLPMWCLQSQPQYQGAKGFERLVRHIKAGAADIRDFDLIRFASVLPALAKLPKKECQDPHNAKLTEALNYTEGKTLAEVLEPIKAQTIWGTSFAWMLPHGISNDGTDPIKHLGVSVSRDRADDSLSIEFVLTTANHSYDMHEPDDMQSCEDVTSKCFALLEALLG